MQKSTIPVGVRTLKKWYDSGNLTFDNPIQRAGSQWSNLSKSLLIHSMISQFPIPSLYLLKSKDESIGETLYDCLDGKQRCEAVLEYISNEYALHSSIPDVEINGTSYEIANKKFEELEQDVQDEISGYRFTIYALEEVSDEEVEEIFARLNNSTPLSPIQKARAVMGSELASWTKELCNSDFLSHACSFSVAQARREATLESLLQTMLLLDARNEGYEYKSISAAEVTRYCRHIRDNFSDEKKSEIEDILGYLSDAFGVEKYKFLKKSQVPMIMVLAQCAIESDISASDFKEFIDEFSSYENEEYSANCGQGNIKKSKTQGRLKAIASDFEEHFGLQGVDILGESEVSDEESSED